MPELLLSVITINYQNVNGLKATIDSVLQQHSNPFWEWIIIDGGSTDGSEVLIKEHEMHFSYCCSEPDNGIYDAMNKGISKAQGRYLWFLNSGDRMYGKQALTHVIQAIQSHPEADCFYSDTLFVNPQYEVLGPISRLKPQTFPKKLTFESFRFGMNICHQSFIARKTIAPLYNTEYRLSADIDWILEILKKRPRCIALEGYLSEFQTGGSSAQNQRKAVKERFAIFQKHFGFWPNLVSHFWIALRRFFFRGKSITA
jgi:glycosyltransferase involved in cell wall biosynthesis